MSVVKLAEIRVVPGDPKVLVVADDSPLSLSAVYILRLMYTALLFYSVLVSWIAGCPWYAMLLYYAAVYIVFYFWHWQAHHRVWWIPFNAKCYEIHQKHHWEIYPPQDFYGLKPKEESSKNNNTIGQDRHDAREMSWLEYFHPAGWLSQHEMLLYLLSTAVMVISRFMFGASAHTIGGALIGIFIMAFIGNYLHHSFHIQEHWLIRYPWFHELRGLHHVHHLGNAKQNYGILNMSLDKILGSFRFDISRPNPLVKKSN